MKAARFYGPKQYVIEEVPTPKCGPGDILLRVLVGAVCGTDVKAYGAGHSLIRNHPVTTGHEFVGEIVEVGSAVRRYEVETGQGKDVRQYEEGKLAVVAPVVACERCENCRQYRFENCTNREDIGFR